MQPYDAPALDEDLDPDHATTRPPLLVPLAGASLGASAFFVVGTGAQLLLFFSLSLPLQLVGMALVLLGLAALVVAPFHMLGRGWAAVAGTVLAGVLGLLSWGWALTALFLGLFSLVAIFAAFLTVPAALLAPFTIGPSLRISAARRALYEG